MDAPVAAVVDRVAERLACRHCIGDPELQAEAADAGFSAVCAYCARRAPCVDVAWLADRVHALLQDAFTPAAHAAARPTAPLRTVPSIELVATAGRFETALALDVHAQLAALHRDVDGGTLYGGGCEYLVPASGVVLDDWRAFAERHALDAGQAVASGQAVDALKWAFAELDGLHGAKGRPVVRTLAAGTRAFVAEIEGAAGGDGPRQCLATDARTALAELRPPAGTRLVVVARVRPTRDCRVLDADALRRALSRASAFTHSGWQAQRRALFVRAWRNALRSAPTNAHDEWSAALRVVAGWLAHGPSPRLDGVVTRSGVGAGRKLVVFAGAKTALVRDRLRRYEVDGTRKGYRRLDGSAEVAGRFAQADREERDDADARHDDEFHGSPP